MNRAYQTEADREDLQRLLPVAARPAEREILRSQGLFPAVLGWHVHVYDCGNGCDVDCGDRQELGRLH